MNLLKTLPKMLLKKILRWYESLFRMIYQLKYSELLGRAYLIALPKTHATKKGKFLKSFCLHHWVYVICVYKVNMWIISMIFKLIIFAANIYLFKVNSKNTRKKCEICSKLTKTPERRHWRHDVLSLLFLLLTLNK